MTRLIALACCATLLLGAAILASCAPPAPVATATPVVQPTPTLVPATPTIAITPLATSTPAVPSGTPATTGPTDFASTVASLEAAGAEVTNQEAAPLFDVVGRQITVNGQLVYVFEFADEATVQQASETIRQAGAQFRGLPLRWDQTPHFYRSGRVILLYVGQDTTTLSALETAMGAPFAAGQG